MAGRQKDRHISRGRSSRATDVCPAHGRGRAGIGRIRRLISILDSLWGGNTVSTRELARICHVSRRTIFRDVAELRDTGIEIVNDRVGQGIRLASNYAVPEPRLSRGEMVAVLVASSAFSLGSNNPFQDAARSATRKLLGAARMRFGPEIIDLAGAISFDLGPGILSEREQAVLNMVVDALDHCCRIRSADMPYARMVRGRSLVATPLCAHL
jgi:predicted DNA-binding transcriptional regulator YafY